MANHSVDMLVSRNTIHNHIFFFAVSYLSYRNYSENDLIDAVTAVLNGQMSQTQASYAFGVPQKTISRKVRKYRQLPTT